MNLPASLQKRTCPTCKRGFSSLATDPYEMRFNIYCSPSCEHQAKLHTRVCKVCNTPFTDASKLKTCRNCRRKPKAPSRLKRKLIENKVARKTLKCKHCNLSIAKGETYTYSTFISFWGSYHNTCFDALSVNFKTEDMGNPVPNQSQVALSLQTGAVLKDLVGRNIQTEGR